MTAETSALLAEAMWLGLLAVLGLAIGSFLNVVVHRLPDGRSLLSPGSACPGCGHPVRSRDNVPVVSWVLLRGRCRDCAAPIAVRYPLVELATAVLFVVVGWRFGATPFTAAALVVTAAGVAHVLIDLEHHRLPFAITRVAALGTVLGLGAELVRHGAGPLAGALGAAALWLAVYGGIWLVTGGRGMGLGDVALAPVLGLLLGWLGWGPALVGLAGGFVIGAVVGVVLLRSGRAGARSRVPHGPFLLAGAALGLLAGDPLAAAYLDLVGLS